MPVAMPEPKEAESDDQYRKRLKAWFETTGKAGENTAGFRQAEWEYLCSLAGIEP